MPASSCWGFFCQEEVRNNKEALREQCSLLNRNLNPNLHLARLFFNPVVAVFYSCVVPGKSTRIHTRTSTPLILRLWWWCIRHSSNSESGICFACALQRWVCSIGARQTLLFAVPLFPIFLQWKQEKSESCKILQGQNVALLMDSIVLKMRKRVNCKSRHNGLDQVLTIPGPTPSSVFQSWCPDVYFPLMNFSSINLFHFFWELMKIWGIYCAIEQGVTQLDCSPWRGLVLNQTVWFDIPYLSWKRKRLQNWWIYRNLL